MVSQWRELGDLVADLKPDLRRLNQHGQGFRLRRPGAYASSGVRVFRVLAMSCSMFRVRVKFNDMYDEATDSEPDERTTLGAREVPRWKWNFKPNADEMRNFLNTPTPLPTGAGSVSAVDNGFHIIFFE
jgi:hypothetical protein